MTAPILTRSIYLRLAAVVTALALVWIGLEALTRAAKLPDLPPMPGRGW